MVRRVSLGELLVGIEGAALLRTLVEGDDTFVAARLEAIRSLLEERDGGPFSLMSLVPELDVESGYAAWAPIYDRMPNALVRAEQPLVEAALCGLPHGVALDAACGTGRHTVRLVAAGHQTVGIDRSEAMLAIARSKVPPAEFGTGDLAELPLATESVDVAVCGLALTHLPDPAPAVAELARVLRPGGRLVISDAHPIFVLIQGQALFPYNGGFAFVRNHVIPHGSYLRAFRSSRPSGPGVEVTDGRCGAW
jgi:SAM-dependent methyltransferase